MTGGTLTFTLQLTDALYGAEKTCSLGLQFGDDFWMFGGGDMPAALETTGTFTFSVPFSGSGGETNVRFPGQQAVVSFSNANPVVALTYWWFWFGPRDIEDNGRHFVITDASIEMASSGSTCIFTGLSPLGDFTALAETGQTAQVSLPSPLGAFSATAVDGILGTLSLPSPLGTFGAKSYLSGVNPYPISDALWVDSPGFTQWMAESWYAISGCTLTPAPTTRVYFDRNSSGNRLYFTATTSESAWSGNPNASIRITMTDGSYWVCGGVMPSGMMAAGTFDFDLPFSSAGGESMSAYFTDGAANVYWLSAATQAQIASISINLGFRDRDGHKRHFQVTNAYLVLNGTGEVVDTLHPPTRTARFAGSSPLGSLSVLAAPDATAMFSGLSPLGDLSVLANRVVYPPAASTLPRDAVTTYRCVITGAPDGLPDLVLPVSSFSVRHRADADSYYHIVVPTCALLDGIAARRHGEIVLVSVLGAIEEELLRGELGSLGTAVGATSQSITISGNTPLAPTERRTYSLDQVLYQSTSLAGQTRLRIPPRAGMRPGDTVIYRGVYTAIGDISWGVSVSQGSLDAQMEIATA